MCSCVVYFTVKKLNGVRTFKRDVDLPFVPTPNVHLVFNNKENDVFSPHSVEYLVEHNVFWLNGHIDTAKDCNCHTCDCGLCFWSSESVAYYTNFGWERQ